MMEIENENEEKGENVHEQEMEEEMQGTLDEKKATHDEKKVKHENETSDDKIPENKQRKTEQNRDDKNEFVTQK